MAAKKKIEVPGIQGVNFITESPEDRRFPATGIPPRAAANAVRAEVVLDHDPDRNLATFVTTWMEPEAREVIMENLHRNYIDHAEYPQTAEVEKRCLRMIHNLFNGPGEPVAPGARCAGSSEAVMLGALAMKWRWRAEREKAGKDTSKPNLVYGKDAHVVWDKFCRYFDVEPRAIDLPEGKYVIGPDEIDGQVDENTIGVVAIVGTTFTGQCDDVEGIAKFLDEYQEKEGQDVPMHIDGASGGFVFPFSDPDFAWDFRIERVKSINASGHKFGMTYPGLGWLIFRDDEQLPEDLVFYEDYLGQRDATFTLNFSTGSSMLLAQYYLFMRLGREGYTLMIDAMDKNAQVLRDKVEAAEFLEPAGSGKMLPLVIAKVTDDAPFTGADLVGELARRRAWVVPAYNLPPGNDSIEVMRILVKINQTRELVDKLASDIDDSIAHLSEHGPNPGPKRPHTGHGY
jgi:glutamate decarboxylase